MEGRTSMLLNNHKPFNLKEFQEERYKRLYTDAEHKYHRVESHQHFICAPKPGEEYEDYGTGTVLKLYPEAVERLLPDGKSCEFALEEFKENQKYPYVMFRHKVNGKFVFGLYDFTWRDFDPKTDILTEERRKNRDYLGFRKTAYYVGDSGFLGKCEVVYPYYARVDGIDYDTPIEQQWAKVPFDNAKEMDDYIKKQEYKKENPPVYKLPFVIPALIAAIVLLIASLLFKSWPAAWFGIISCFVCFVSWTYNKYRGKKNGGKK